MEEVCLPASVLGPVEWVAFWRLVSVRVEAVILVFPGLRVAGIFLVGGCGCLDVIDNGRKKYFLGT